MQREMIYGLLESFLGTQLLLAQARTETTAEYQPLTFSLLSLPFFTTRTQHNGQKTSQDTITGFTAAGGNARPFDSFRHGRARLPMRMKSRNLLKVLAAE